MSGLLLAAVMLALALFGARLFVVVGVATVRLLAMSVSAADT